MTSARQSLGARNLARQASFELQVLAVPICFIIFLGLAYPGGTTGILVGAVFALGWSQLSGP
jgi:hypothetical protein